MGEGARTTFVFNVDKELMTFPVFNLRAQFVKPPGEAAAAAAAAMEVRDFAICRMIKRDSAYRG